MNQRFRVLQELGDQFEQVMATTPSRTVHPSRTWTRFSWTGRKVWTAVGALSVALSAGIVATVLLLSSSASVAYADWSPDPLPASASTIASASTTCANAFTGTGATANQRAFSQQPVLAETRGVSTALIEISDGDLYSCVTGRNPQLQSPAIKISDYGATVQAPGANQITVPYGLQSGVGGGYIGPEVPRPPRSASQTEVLDYLAVRESHGFGRNALGQAGSDVKAVSFIFADGQSVSATLQNGWYFAWWPWLTNPISATVTTASATLSSPVESQGPITRKSIVAGCQPDAAGCVFANTTSTPAATPSGAPSRTTSTVTNAAP
jgi:hypothetical protein